MKVLSWVGFAGAVATLAAVPFLLTADNDSAMFLIVLPPLLLTVGWLRSNGAKAYVVGCLALCVLLDVLLLIVMLEAGLMNGFLARTWISNSLAAVVAGGLAAVSAARGHVKPQFGYAGAALALTGALIGALILKMIIGLGG